jgi:hypothetical protein
MRSEGFNIVAGYHFDLDWMMNNYRGRGDIDFDLVIVPICYGIEYRRVSRASDGVRHLNDCGRCWPDYVPVIIRHWVEMGYNLCCQCFLPASRSAIGIDQDLFLRYYCVNCLECWRARCDSHGLFLFVFDEIISVFDPCVKACLGILIITGGLTTYRNTARFMMLSRSKVYYPLAYLAEGDGICYEFRDCMMDGMVMGKPVTYDFSTLAGTVRAVIAVMDDSEAHAVSLDLPRDPLTGLGRVNSIMWYVTKEYCPFYELGISFERIKWTHVVYQVCEPYVCRCFNVPSTEIKLSKIRFSCNHKLAILFIQRIRKMVQSYGKSKGSIAAKHMQLMDEFSRYVAMTGDSIKQGFGGETPVMIMDF